MTNHCPNCGVAGLNLNCNLHFMPMFGNMTNPCKEIPLPIIDRTQAQDREKELLAEIGRLSLQLRAAELQAHTLQAKLSDLEADGTIDQMGRKLPLPDHHSDCPHGQNGWAMCTCDELKARDIRNAKALDRVFDDLMDDDEGPKKCLHGNTECKRCNPVRAIKTPEGKPLLPAVEFSRMRIEDNKERGLSECNWQRCTGRTTAMVIEALEFVKANRMGGVVIDVHDQGMKRHIRDLLQHYAGELGVDSTFNARIFMKAPSDGFIHGVDVGLQLRDNIIDDLMGVKPTRDPRQDLKPGDHVRFEIEGIIKERQSAGIFQDEDGNDFEPIQYAIKDSINRMTYYVGYHQITKKIGSVE
jgi:hypothetical protein